jgi:flagellin-like hook-associated protein FlgL
MGQPNNLSSSSQAEDVGYISGPFGEWSDSTEDPNQFGVKGYLFEKDNKLSDVTLSGVEKTIEWVAHYRAVAGSESMQVSVAGDSARVCQNNLEAANSRIADVDLANETVALARSKILMESGAKMLQSAQEALQVVLKLLPQL